MNTITYSQLPELYSYIAAEFQEKKDELCEMDAKMGDGDLGLTMSKGFTALPQLIMDYGTPGDISKTLMTAGMKMAGIVPSTMGTLMASGVMQGGKALKGKNEIGPAELADYLTGFAAGIQKRGKCSAGDRTIFDALDPAAKLAREAAAQNKDLKGVIEAAVSGANFGVEATRTMKPKFGKAAVFSSIAEGVIDQGAVAGKYMLIGMQNYILSRD